MLWNLLLRPFISFDKDPDSGGGGAGGSDDPGKGDPAKGDEKDPVRTFNSLRLMPCKLNGPNMPSLRQLLTL